MQILPRVWLLSVLGKLMNELERLTAQAAVRRAVRDAK